jgi:hypothetical protein
LKDCSILYTCTNDEKPWKSDYKPGLEYLIRTLKTNNFKDFSWANIFIMNLGKFYTKITTFINVFVSSKNVLDSYDWNLYVQIYRRSKAIYALKK